MNGQLVADVIKFLMELAGEIPYDQREIKGSDARSTRAQQLLSQIRAHDATSTN